MIVVICLECALGIRVMPNLGDRRSVTELDHLVGRNSPFFPDKYPCPRCSVESRCFMEHEVDPRVLCTLTLHDLTAAEAYSAFMGLGFPDEQRCSLETVQGLLLEKPVRKVHGKNVEGIERAIIDHLELWDGTKIYFGAGADGAAIYRITRPVSYVDKVLAEIHP